MQDPLRWVNVIDFISLLLCDYFVSRIIFLRGHHLVIFGKRILPPNSLKRVYQISWRILRLEISKSSVIIEHVVRKQEISADFVCQRLNLLLFLLVFPFFRVRRHYDIHELFNELFQILVFVIISDSMPEGVLIQSPLKESDAVQEATRLCELI